MQEEKTKRKKLKSQIGVVVSDKMEETAVVRIQRLATHRLYKKIIRLERKVKAHNPDNAAKVADVVRIIPSRPISKDKRYRIIEVIKHIAE